LADTKLYGALILAANFVGVSTGVMAFSLIASFIKFRAEGKVIAFRGIKLPEPPGGLSGLLLYGGLALAAGLMSAGLIYGSKWAINKVSRHYHKLCIVRAIKCLSVLSPETIGKLNFLSPKHGPKHIPTIYSRYVAFSYRFFLEASLPLITLAFSMCVLVYLDAFITASLIPFAVIYLIPLYRVNVRSAKAQGKYLASVVDFFQWVKRTIGVLAESDNPRLRSINPELVSKTPVLEKTTKALYDRLLLRFRADFLSRILLVICMVWLFVVFGWRVLKYERSWLSILAFTVALRFTGASLQQVVSRFVSISRFYPSVELFRKFLEASQKDETSQPVSSDVDKIDSNTISFSCPFCSLPGTCGQGELVRGTAAFALAPEPRVKKRMKNLLIAIAEETRHSERLAHSTYYHISDQLIESLSIIENILGDQWTESDVRDLEKAFDGLGVLSEIRSLPDYLNTVCDSSTSEKLSNEARFAVSSIYCLLFHREIVFLSAKGFLQLNSEFQYRFLSMLSNSFVVLISTRPSDILKHSGNSIARRLRSVVVFDGNKIAGVGPVSWLREQADKVELFIQGVEKESPRELFSEFALDDFDIDEEI
jgi:hypothetical protein